MENLLLRVIDYGDSIRLNESMRRFLNAGCSTEKNQRSYLALSAGFEWALRKRPNSVPCLQRVGFLASGLVAEEFRLAVEVREMAAEMEIPTSH